MQPSLNKAIIDRLLVRLQEKRGLIDLARQTDIRVYLPATVDSVQNAETILRFQLPDLLRDIYIQVANGGFGPGFGLIGLNDGALDDQGHSITDLYTFNIQAVSYDFLWYWPEKLLPVCHWGDAIYSCLDCSQTAAPVIVFDPNRHNEAKDWRDAFIPHMPSFAEWLEAWLDGVDLWKYFLVDLPLENQILELLRDEKKISAILLYQKEKPCSLEEARRYVDGLDARL